MIKSLLAIKDSFVATTNYFSEFIVGQFYNESNDSKLVPSNQLTVSDHFSAWLEILDIGIKDYRMSKAAFIVFLQEILHAPFGQSMRDVTLSVDDKGMLSSTPTINQSNNEATIKKLDAEITQMKQVIHDMTLREQQNQTQVANLTTQLDLVNGRLSLTQSNLIAKEGEVTRLTLVNQSCNTTAAKAQIEAHEKTIKDLTLLKNELMTKNEVSSKTLLICETKVLELQKDIDKHKISALQGSMDLSNCQVSLKNEQDKNVALKEQYNLVNTSLIKCNEELSKKVTISPVVTPSVVTPTKIDPAKPTIKTGPSKELLELVNRKLSADKVTAEDFLVSEDLLKEMRSLMTAEEQQLIDQDAEKSDSTKYQWTSQLYPKVATRAWVIIIMSVMHCMRKKKLSSPYFYLYMLDQRVVAFHMNTKINVLDKIKGSTSSDSAGSKFSLPSHWSWDQSDYNNAKSFKI